MPAYRWPAPLWRLLDRLLDAIEAAAYRFGGLTVEAAAACEAGACALCDEQRHIAATTRQER